MIAIDCYLVHVWMHISKDMSIDMKDIIVYKSYDIKSLRLCVGIWYTYVEQMHTHKYVIAMMD